MKYLVIGAGGTGGPIGAFLTKAGKDVTLIARGEHLKKMQSEGLYMETPEGNYTVPVQAFDMEHYNETPDVIFVCVKGYSLDDATEFIRRVAGPETTVIPILNIFGTGSRLQEKLPDITVTDGCIYIAAEMLKPGHIRMNGMIFRVVYGLRKPEEGSAELKKKLEEIEKDLKDSGITPIYTDHVQRDCLRKFSYVSPQAACGEYYHVAAGPIQEKGEIRDTFAALIHEIEILAEAMGIDFGEDMVATNLAILDNLTPQATTSMQRDVAKGHASEMDGLIFAVPRMAEQYGVTLPVYNKMDEEMRKRGF